MTDRRSTSTIVRGLTLLLLTLLPSCSGVDVMRLTSATFPPKASVEEVEVLEQAPVRPFLRLAELHMDDPSMSFARMQEHLLAKAASLGADAVVFSKPVQRIEHQIAYAPTYSPWGYYSPFYVKPFFTGIGQEDRLGSGAVFGRPDRRHCITQS